MRRRPLLGAVCGTAVSLAGCVGSNGPSPSSPPPCDEQPPETSEFSDIFVDNYTPDAHTVHVRVVATEPGCTTLDDTVTVAPHGARGLGNPVWWDTPHRIHVVVDGNAESFLWADGVTEHNRFVSVQIEDEGIEFGGGFVN